MSLTIGSDPELMLAQDGNLLSALTHIRGRKYYPLDLRCGAKVLADNVNVEINPLPATTEEEFISNIRNALRDLTEILPNKQVLARAAAVFPDTEMQDPEAFLFGCEPEFAAWEQGNIVFPPQIEHGNSLRTCGGHIHIGYEPALKDPLRVIQAMDLFIGVPMVMINHDDSSPTRRCLYGGAGKFRPTKYGVEYRTPDNYWMRHPRLAEMMFILTDICMSNLDLPSSADAYRAVDTHDVKLANNVFNIVSERIPRFLINDIEDFAKNAFSDDVLKNWEI